jgi:hypothetical protein
MLNSTLRRRLIVGAAVAVLVALAIIFWPNPAVPPAKHEGEKSVETKEAHKAKALAELKEYVDLLEIREMVRDDAIQLRAVYENEGKKWGVASLEKARKKEIKLLKLHEILERRLNILGEQYGDVDFEGQGVREFCLRQKEALAKDTTAAEKRKDFWDTEIQQRKDKK